MYIGLYFGGLGFVGVKSMQLLYSVGLMLYNRPQLRMVLPFGISKFFDVVYPL